MQEKLTISISSKTKNSIKRLARQQNKTVSRFLEELFAEAIKKKGKDLPEDEWINQTAGLYRMGSNDVFNELFKGIAK